MKDMDEAKESTPLIDSNVAVIPKKDDNDVTHDEAQRHPDSTHIDQNKQSNSDVTPELAEHGKKEEFKFFSTLSSRKKYTIVLLTLANFLAGCAFSLLGPFYPVEAAKKGMSQTIIGLVFGIFGVVVFITAPIFGNYLTKLRPRFVLFSGIFLGGSCNVIFGTLYMCPDRVSYAVMSLLVRAVESIGFSGYITASYAIVTYEFKDNIGFAFSLLETGMGLGFVVGPTLGGALFELGGFGLPFYCAGIAVLTNGLLAWKFLPPVEYTTKKRKGSMLGLLRSPMVVVPMLSVFVGVMGITVYDSTFSKHLQPLKLSVGIIGLLFGVEAVIYTLTSCFWGYLSDTKDIQSPLIIIGNSLSGIAFLIIGPSVILSFIPFNLWTICIGLVFLGLSLGCHLIPTMKCMIIGAIETGLEDNIDTYALVSGLFNSLYTLGGFVGPVVIGALVEEYDFPTAYTVVAMCFFFMLIVSAIFFVIRNFNLRRGPKEEITFTKSGDHSFSEDPRDELVKSSNSAASISMAFNKSVSVIPGSFESSHS